MPSQQLRSDTFSSEGIISEYSPNVANQPTDVQTLYGKKEQVLSIDLFFSFANKKVEPAKDSTYLIINEEKGFDLAFCIASGVSN